jgi:hypothetical protein
LEELWNPSFSCTKPCFFEPLEGVVGLNGGQAVILLERFEFKVEAGHEAAAGRQLVLVGQGLVHLPQDGFRRVGQFDAPPQVVEVGGVVEGHGVGFFLVAAPAAGFLVVGFQRVGQVHVHHHPHVGLVDAHAEGVGRHDHPGAVVDPVVLFGRPLRVVEAGVVEVGPHAVLVEQVGQFLGALAVAYVHDGRAGHVAQDLQQLPLLVFFQEGRVGEVGPGEAFLEKLAVAPELQFVGNVLAHGNGGRGREGNDGHLRQQVAQLGNFQVGGAEVVAPLEMQCASSTASRPTRMSLSRSRNSSVRVRSGET